MWILRPQKHQLTGLSRVPAGHFYAKSPKLLDIKVKYIQGNISLAKNSSATRISSNQAINHYI